jgi:hypothetical protein
MFSLFFPIDTPRYFASRLKGVFCPNPRKVRQVISLLLVMHFQMPVKCSFGNTQPFDSGMIIGTKYLANQSNFTFPFHMRQKRTLLAAVVKGVADEPSRKTNGRFKR